MDGRKVRRILIDDFDEAPEPVRGILWVDDQTDLPLRLEKQHRVNGDWVVRGVLEFVFNQDLPSSLFDPESLSGGEWPRGRRCMEGGTTETLSGSLCVSVAPVRSRVRTDQGVRTNRPAIDRNYSCALVVVFDDQERHDLHQVHEIHDRFREQCSRFWDKVFIYDSVTQES